MERAYRRPIHESDLGELLTYYRDGVADVGFVECIRSAVTGILASPYFLYRAERVPEGVAAIEPGQLVSVMLLDDAPAAQNPSEA